VGPRDSGARPILLEEARRHHDAQVAAYRDVDGKALEVMKVNGVLLALVATIGGVVPRLDAAPHLPVAVLLLAAVGLSATTAAIVVAAVAYTRSTLKSGVTGFTDASLRTRYTARDVEAFVLEVYEEMIRDNRRTIEKIAFRVDTAILLLITAVLLFAASGSVLIVGVW
jgi:hypothetical protein